MRRYLEFMHLIQRQSTTQLGGLLLGLWGLGVCGLPVEAAELASWNFDRDRNQLEFTTDQDVQPRVKLIPNPTRLVVDLPGIQFNQPTLNQNVGAAVHSVRVGRFDEQTTRIVVELAPDYTLDPNQVKVQGTSPQTWLVNLPQPQRWRPPAEPVAPSSAQAHPPSAASSAIAQSATQIEDLRITPDGLFLQTAGQSPQVEVQRSRKKTEITVAIANASLEPVLNQQAFDPKYHGIQKISITQQTQPVPKAYLQLEVAQNSPDWLASVSPFGIALLPQGGASIIPNSRRPNASVSLVESLQPSEPVAQSSRLTTIQGVSLRNHQLLIRADKPIDYTRGWNGTTHWLTLRSAQLAANFRSPQLRADSPLSELQVREQKDRGTVTILAKAADGVRITGVQRFSDNVLGLAFRRVSTGTASIPPTPQFPQPRPGTAQPDLPKIGQRVVVIDPGHGGRDPGAVGIGGLRETDVVLDISLEVERILKQQGVTVYLTRNTEREVDLAPRVDFAENRRADVFVSIHANAISLSRPDVNGVETYHAPGAQLGSRLAHTIHRVILQTFNMRDRGVKAANFYVIRKTTMPSVLVETGFVTGNEDYKLLRDSAWRKQMAGAIARGILLFLSGRTS